MKKNGFTLIEVMTVVILLGVLGLIIVPIVSGVIKDQKESLYQSQLRAIEKKCEDWAYENLDLLPTNEGEEATVTLLELKKVGNIPLDLRNPKTGELFPNDLQITIRYTNGQYVFKVVEGTGTDVSDNINKYNPIVLLNGSFLEYLEMGSTYQEKGVSAKDYNGNVINNVDIQYLENGVEVASISSNAFKTYTANYTVKSTVNGQEYTSHVVRTIIVRDTTAPELTIPGNIAITLAQANTFNLLDGVSYNDNSGETLTVHVSELDKSLGQKKVSYTVCDSSSNCTTKNRLITITEDLILTSELLKQYRESNTVGLLKDDTGYYYKGNNSEVSNNYVWYEGHLWRVLSIDNDSNITMITEQPLTSIYPVKNNNSSSSGGSTISSTIDENNVIRPMRYTWDNSLEYKNYNIPTPMATTARYNWASKTEYEASYVNTWLNNVFLNSISDQSKIISHAYNIGLYTSVTGIVSTQKVGLLDYVQYTKAGAADSFLNIKDSFWIGNRYDSSKTAFINETIQSDSIGGSALGVRPVIQITSITGIQGEGTLTNPYRLFSSSTDTTNVKVGEYISVSTTGTDCGSDKRCVFRVVSKDVNSVKVILNGVLKDKNVFNSDNAIGFSSTSSIGVKITNFANTIDNQYHVITNKTFNTGAYVSLTPVSYTTLNSSTYTGKVGLPVVGEMFSGNDIDLGTTKSFVNETVIENSTVADIFWTMNGDTTISIVTSDGSLSSASSKGGLADTGYGVRPTLFLKNNLTFTGGEGTAEHPFTLG